MAERAGDEQICLAFQGGGLNDAGWRVSLRLHGCDIDCKTSLSERGRKAVSGALVNLLIIGDGNQDDTRDLFQQQSGACQCPRDSGSSIPGDGDSIDAAGEIIRGKKQERSTAFKQHALDQRPHQFRCFQNGKIICARQIGKSLCDKRLPHIEWLDLDLDLSFFRIITERLPENGSIVSAQALRLCTHFVYVKE